MFAKGVAMLLFVSFLPVGLLCNGTVFAQGTSTEAAISISGLKVKAGEVWGLVMGKLGAWLLPLREKAKDRMVVIKQEFKKEMTEMKQGMTELWKFLKEKFKIEK